MILYFIPSLTLAAFSVFLFVVALSFFDLFLQIFFVMLSLLILRAAWVEYRSELRLMRRMRELR